MNEVYLFFGKTDFVMLLCWLVKFNMVSMIVNRNTVALRRNVDFRFKYQCRKINRLRWLFLLHVQMLIIEMRIETHFACMLEMARNQWNGHINWIVCISCNEYIGNAYGDFNGS